MTCKIRLENILAALLSKSSALILVPKFKCCFVRLFEVVALLNKKVSKLVVCQSVTLLVIKMYLNFSLGFRVDNSDINVARCK